MNIKLDQNVLYRFNVLTERVELLEKELISLRDKYDDALEREKHHLIRIKNGDQLPDDYILRGTNYIDLSPEKAFEFYNDNDKDFILLDVSKTDHSPAQDFQEVTKIPLEELEMRASSLTNKGACIFVICESGVRSILACHYLHSLGFYNLNNVSGGYKFWPGLRTIELIQKESA
jgi:rhodanese-related sulfurtransferase